MAAKARYPPVHQQIRELAERARREGVSFDAFWERAVRPGKPPVTWQVPELRRPEGAVVWPKDSADRAVSIAATLGARDGWRRCYELAPPSRGEAALLRLRPALDQLAEAVAA